MLSKFLAQFVIFFLPSLFLLQLQFTFLRNEQKSFQTEKLCDCSHSVTEPQKLGAAEQQSAEAPNKTEGSETILDIKTKSSKTTQSVPTEVLRTGVEPAATLLHNMDVKHLIVRKRGTRALSFERQQMQDHENKFTANGMFFFAPNF